MLFIWNGNIGYWFLTRGTIVYESGFFYFANVIVAIKGELIYLLYDNIIRTIYYKLFISTV